MARQKREGRAMGLSCIILVMSTCRRFSNVLSSFQKLRLLLLSWVFCCFFGFVLHIRRLFLHDERRLEAEGKKGSTIWGSWGEKEKKRIRRTSGNCAGRRRGLLVLIASGMCFFLLLPFPFTFFFFFFFSYKKHTHTHTRGVDVVHIPNYHGNLVEWLGLAWMGWNGMA